LRSKVNKMDEYTVLKDAFIDNGISEDSASRLAEIINDYGASYVRSILNSIELN